jgi:hypothetical protein
MSPVIKAEEKKDSVRSNASPLTERVWDITGGVDMAIATLNDINDRLEI